jgi:transcriptional regulator with XRE-family HTH domain
MTFAQKLEKLLKEQRRSQSELAKAVGTSQQVVSNWVSNGIIPKTPFILLTARFLGVSADYLLDDQREDPDDFISDVERLFLVAVREMGYEKAMRILVRAIPDSVSLQTEVATTEAPSPESSPEYWQGKSSYVTTKPTDSKSKPDGPDLPSGSSVNRPV